MNITQKFQRSINVPIANCCDIVMLTISFWKDVWTLLCWRQMTTVYFKEIWYGKDSVVIKLQLTNSQSLIDMWITSPFPKHVSYPRLTATDIIYHTISP